MSPARPTHHRNALRAAGFFTAIAALPLTGCYFSDDGLEPPSRAFYFPTGLAVSPGRGALYTANSDFDLQYNGGTVSVIDLRVARGALDEMLVGLRCAQQAEDACATLGVSTSQAPTVDQVCRGIPFRAAGKDVPGAEPALTNGKDCVAANQCESGVCAESKCKACTSNADCINGVCTAGVCMLVRNENAILTPSACTPMAPPFADNGSTFATIGAFASGAVLAMNNSRVCSVTGDACLVDEDCGGAACEVQGGARLFVPVRGDPSITWFDVVDDRPQGFQGSVKELDCGQRGTDQRCSDDNRMGVDPYDNFRTLTLPVEPVGLDVTDDGTAIVSAHQIAATPSIGLSLNQWSPDDKWDPRPTFQFYTSGGVAAGPGEVARVPVPALVTRTQKLLAGPGVMPISYQPGFLVTYNASPEVDLFRYNDDALSSPPRPFMTRAAAGGINTNADGKDSRGIVVDPSARQACEATCPGAADQLACLRACVDIPLDVFIANRTPPSLLLGRVRTVIVDSAQGGTVGSGAFDFPEIYDVVALSVGPSKVALGQVIGMDGLLHPRVFAVTFESRLIFSYDPEARRVDAVIRTGRGPHALTFDTCLGDCANGEAPHSYLYVGHFTDSYLGVVDLDMRHPETFGIMFASIGTPTPPRESK